MTSSLVLTLVLGLLVLGWLGLALYAVAGRAAHDLRARRVAARTSSSGRALSRRALRRAAGDADLPPGLAQALAFEAAAHIGLERLRCQAAAHRTELGKWRRLEALRILSIVDERSALPLLEDALRADEDLGAAAAAILGGLTSVPSARVLADAIGESQVPDSRLAGSLDAHPRDLSPIVLALAADPVPARRYWGVTLLRRYAASDASLQSLRLAAADPDANVRAAAAEALGAAATGGLDELRALVADDAWFVRTHAARALAGRRPSGAAGAVAPLLADASWWVRSAAKDALASLGREVEGDIAPYLVHADGFARNGAAEVLERVGVVDSVLGAAAGETDHATLRYAQAIVAASEEAFLAALERMPEELRPRLLEIAGAVPAVLQEAA